MDMKTKSKLIKKLRNGKLWSQDELASACDLSLRTIQRLESSGNASLETVKALASVFEVDADDIVCSDENFEMYKHVQRGNYMLLALGIVGFILLILQYETAAMPPATFGLIYVGLGILSILFYSMTIEVTESDVSWYFGPRFWRKTIKLAEIDNIMTTCDPLWWGFGVRFFGDGSLYRVSGLLAVKINLKSGMQIRLGTDEPNYLSAAINKALARISTN